jgi:hypothetical protein
VLDAPLLLPLPLPCAPGELLLVVVEGDVFNAVLSPALIFDPSCVAKVLVLFRGPKEPLVAFFEAEFPNGFKVQFRGIGIFLLHPGGLSIPQEISALTIK